MRIIMLVTAIWLCAAPVSAQSECALSMSGSALNACPQVCGG